MVNNDVEYIQCIGCKEWWPVAWITKGQFYDLCPECNIDFNSNGKCRAWKGLIPNYPVPNESIYHLVDIIGVINNVERRKPTLKERIYIKMHKYKVKYY